MPKQPEEKGVNLEGTWKKSKQPREKQIKLSYEIEIGMSRNTGTYEGGIGNSLEQFDKMVEKIRTEIAKGELNFASITFLKQ